MNHLRKRGIILMLGGVALPPVAFLLTGLFVEPPAGMDSYVPAFVAGFAGAVLGAVLFLVGIALLIQARRQRGVENSGRS